MAARGARASALPHASHIPVCTVATILPLHLRLLSATIISDGYLTCYMHRASVLSGKHRIFLSDFPLQHPFYTLTPPVMVHHRYRSPGVAELQVAGQITASGHRSGIMHPWLPIRLPSPLLTLPPILAPSIAGLLKILPYLNLISFLLRLLRTQAAINAPTAPKSMPRPMSCGRCQSWRKVVGSWPSDSRQR